MKIIITVYLIGIALVCLLIGCATLPKDFDKPTSHAFTETDNTIIGNVSKEEKKFHPGQSGFLLLSNGLDAFVARAVLAQYAERSIDAQYYLFHSDLVGLLLMDQLFKAADRGANLPAPGRARRAPCRDART